MSTKATYARAKIIRAPHKKDYFCMQRATAQDDSLSWEARGVIAYILSKPDNWEIQVKDLEQGCKKGRVYRILDELKEAGYLEERQQKQDDKGRYYWTPYILHERPLSNATKEQEKPQPESPYPQKPDMGEPDMDEPYLENADVYKVVSNKVENKNTTAPEARRVTEIKTCRPQKKSIDVTVIDFTAPIPTLDKKAWYNAVRSVWGFEGGRNINMQKFLRGEVTDKKRLQDMTYQLPPGNSLTPDKLQAWGQDYRARVLKNNITLNMVTSPEKIQSDILAYLRKMDAPQTVEVYVLEDVPNSMIFDGAGEGVVRFDWTPDEDISA